LNPKPAAPKRGEVWLVRFDPTLGAEIQKTRPALVISSDMIGRLPIKLVAPITDWKDHYATSAWHVRVEPDMKNGLTKRSAVDTLQLRSIDHGRFIRKLGDASRATINDVLVAIALVIEYPL
jgi:mRNA interferase MazF